MKAARGCAGLLRSLLASLVVRLVVIPLGPCALPGRAACTGMVLGRRTPCTTQWQQLMQQYLMCCCQGGGHPVKQQ